MTYTIVAYPNGRRTIVATLHTDSHRERDIEFVARFPFCASPGAEVEGIVAHAAVQARVRGEFVDVYREDGPGAIATVGP